MTNEDTYSGAYVEFLNARIMQEQARAEAAEAKVAQVKADAWDEGYEGGANDIRWYRQTPTTNPYRQETPDDE